MYRVQTPLVEWQEEEGAGMSGSPAVPADHLTLFKLSVVNQLSGFCECAGELDANDLI